MESKILVVYYSLEGNTKLIAETISNEVSADILEVKPKKDIEPHSKIKYLIGGKQAITKEKPELVHYDVNIENYEILFIGTPVWAWTFAPAIRSFFANTNLKNKKIALFSCNGGANGKTFQNMKAELGGNEFLGEIEFKDPLKNDRGENVEKAKKWSQDICKLNIK
ncbi:flavodoxin family protein [Clostridium kluyveri]|uniref:Flavodoxin n=1 Tax=Clostridium kluyveri TaxID=1534 RepID=A0A1L5F538_CLOKL|nr:flavodoxin [Clostridium kluyveri]APM38125.1 flavodoxin [Clostridium kluyveri]UZQ51866.1 flavodoxin [Clostridium kluyveri]